MDLAIATVLVVVNLVLAVSVFVSLPGHWAMLAIALGLHLWRGEFSWWVLGGVLLVCVLAEVLEFLAGAAGAKVGGGSRSAVWGATLGGVVGAVLGTLFLPIPLLGTVVGAAVGAAVAAVAVEAGVAEKRSPVKLAKLGAATLFSRAAALIIKGVLALLIALALSLDAFIGV